MSLTALSGRSCSHSCAVCQTNRRVERALPPRTMKGVDRELATLRQERDRLQKQLKAQVRAEEPGRGLDYFMKHGLTVPRTTAELDGGARLAPERAIYASRYATTRPEQESAHASRARR